MLAQAYTASVLISLGTFSEKYYLLHDGSIYSALPMQNTLVTLILVMVKVIWTTEIESCVSSFLINFFSSQVHWRHDHAVDFGR